MSHHRALARRRTLGPARHAWWVRKKRLVGPHFYELEGEIDDYSAKLVTALEDSGVCAGTEVEWHPHARRFILYGVGEAPPESVQAVIDAAPEVVKLWRSSGDQHRTHARSWSRNASRSRPRRVRSPCRARRRSHCAVVGPRRGQCA